MATYTVIQDIEAEDKFVGPLTLKQFIFAGAGIFFAYLCVFAATRGGAILILFFGPPALLGFFLAIPWSKDQPTEVWVLAKLRFKFKPKARIWDQSGLEELVTITAPKKIERQLTNGLSATEVKSRLKALAETIDTRGWAVKNATLNDTRNPYQLPGTENTNSQRLVDIDTGPREVPDVDLNQLPDVLDDNTPVADKFNDMIQTSSQEHRQRSLANMDRVRNGEPIESVNQPEEYFSDPQYTDEAQITQQLRNQRQAGDLANQHMHGLPSAQTPVQPVAAQTQAQKTYTPDSDIINLAQNNDWTVETIARNAKKDKDQDEVVISLR